MRGTSLKVATVKSNTLRLRVIKWNGVGESLPEIILDLSSMLSFSYSRIIISAVLGNDMSVVKYKMKN